MTPAIKKVIKSSGLLVCPACLGDGSLGYFCGHYTTTQCRMCEGNGIVKSLKKQKHKKTCVICSGKGGVGCCKNKGFHEWESYELIKIDLL